jgi:lipopolysaccharide/colanic/teichoic acid biosynthesis glycosyltransferase
MDANSGVLKLGGENMLCDKAICDKAVPEDAGASCGGCEGPRRGLYVSVKSVAEWIASLAMFIVLAPLVGALGILVKLSSPGPAFYSQIRLGRYGKPYRIFKLRTMSHNCEAKTGAVWSSGLSDPRVTRFGRLLRDTHLDELPQLWNVLRGDMSLIGPRPERPEIASKIDQALPRYRHRLMVRPGVTGLAQVQLPPDSDLESVRRKLAYDLHYVREVTFMLDMKILLATFFHFLASAINAVGAALVKNEKAAVESRNYGGLKVIARDTWRVGAA